MSRTSDMQYSGQNLIFLISQPRAGSTLTQRILAGHPDICTSAEPWTMLHPLYALRPQGMQAEYDANLAWMALQDYLDYVDSDEVLYYKAVCSFAKPLYEAAIEKEGKSLFLDKTPRYYLIIEELIRTFPDARVILLFRNPLAVLASILKNWVRDDFKSLSVYYHDLIEAPWFMTKALEHHKDRVTMLRYEDLVSQPEGVIRSMCKSINLDYHPEMLNYAQKEAPVGLMGDAINVHKHDKPVSEYSDKWIKLFNRPDYLYVATSYLDGLGPDLLQKMGYSYDEIKTQLGVTPSIQGSVPQHIIKGISETLGLPGDIGKQVSNRYHHGLKVLLDRRKKNILEQLDRFISNKKYEQAGLLIEKRETAFNNDPDFELRKAVYLYQTGNPGSAKKVLNGIIREYPNYVPAIVSMTELYANEGKINQAMNLAKRAYQQAPNQKEVLQLYIHLGDILGQYEQLELPLKRLLSVDPKNQWALEKAVKVYTKLGEEVKSNNYRQLLDVLKAD